MTAAVNNVLTTEIRDQERRRQTLLADDGVGTVWCLRWSVGWNDWKQPALECAVWTVEWPTSQLIS